MDTIENLCRQIFELNGLEGKRRLMARDQLEGELRAFVDEGYSPRPRVYLGTEEAEEQDQAMKMAHELFERYCSRYETASSMELTPEEFVGDYFENEEAVIRKAHEIYSEGDNLLMLARTLRNVAVLGYENGLC